MKGRSQIKTSQISNFKNFNTNFNKPHIGYPILRYLEMGENIPLKNERVFEMRQRETGECVCARCVIFAVLFFEAELVFRG